MREYARRREYGLYKGEELLIIGTLEEIAKERGIKIASLLFYATPSYEKRGKKNGNRLALIKL